MRRFDAIFSKAAPKHVIHRVDVSLTPLLEFSFIYIKYYYRITIQSIPKIKQNMKKHPWRSLLLYILVLGSTGIQTFAWNVVIAGGTGPVGQALVARLSEPTTSSSVSSQPPYNITLLARNAFLAATPTRVSHDYGWVGAAFLNHFRGTVQLRDWDGGDLLDIVGQDWIGWQDDTLAYADCVIHGTGGGYTAQRVQACERLVRESLRVNPRALHITVHPTDDLLAQLSPGLSTVKQARIQLCEDMVRTNLPRSICLRIPDRPVEAVCERIVAAMYSALPTTTV